MDHAQHTPLSSYDLTGEVVEGATIYDPNDEEVGDISHMHGSGGQAHAIVDVGTFLGMGGKSVSIPISSLRFMRDESGTVHATTTWSRADIEALPEHHHI